MLDFCGFHSVVNGKNGCLSLVCADKCACLRRRRTRFLINENQKKNYFHSFQQSLFFFFVEKSMKMFCKDDVKIRCSTPCARKWMFIVSRRGLTVPRVKIKSITEFLWNRAVVNRKMDVYRWSASKSARICAAADAADESNYKRKTFLFNNVFFRC